MTANDSNEGFVVAIAHQTRKNGSFQIGYIFYIMTKNAGCMFKKTLKPLRFYPAFFVMM
jgi:hypothetical protein